MNISLEDRLFYRGKLIAYYFNKQKIKDENTMAAVRRQVVNMDDPRLLEDYNRIFGS